ncbi:hypothetical protein NQ315_010770 [Exocentrus adspersus]|uniref:protein-lysine 6-oxidase n=1 Tax=Exocentrus adspersus TaxID=1586481 RepID=A0AAV8VVC6_9CUCU|nr:hypothetical protein NQ315_010770 [Exocentrus adspersus]
MKPIHTFICVFLFLSHILCDSPEDAKRKRALLVKKHLKRLKKIDGAIKLVGGRGEFEGNVEILHEGSWGAICDDEWDVNEARVICKQLGYLSSDAEPTVNSYFGPARRKYWMDNVYCDGSEEEISQCRFDGWGQNDCTSTEAAGVICSEPEEPKQKPKNDNKISMTPLGKDVKVRLKAGRVATEGRVEIKNAAGQWNVICGDGWSLFEALVVCRTLSLGYASDAMQTDFFGGNLTSESLGGIKCTGNETTFHHCLYNQHATGNCQSKDVAAVSCTETMSDLVIDHVDLMRTAHLEDKQMFFLQCAMEENCVASTAYEVQKENDAWHLETRRLLRFTARIFNAGNADFRPAIPKHLWEWHMCHMHYHSMEVFATFDIYNSTGQRVAEGHKASFCLEDNQCLPGVEPKYACANYGDQGISVNCSDIYKYTVDCQWVDISDLEPGKYRFKVAVNPEFKVPEMSFENNAAVCDFFYTETFGSVTNCVVQRP